ncbi:MULTISPECIES: phage tail tape measure protein [unclassified Bacillus (in: firmicutes)]|uniref:phage tail tape measure protein n=1 Tax=unclassified Bacillus (in: firmicutes) TaxID=185979 RepID=UPI001BE91718|nr:MULTISPECIES: phage tail tape measure protein [unclassified Bacillus (in: firmicutes)]MBT2615333.1 phage tail tape measure protein [Bacillus sp. ISL-78]MBT2628053.1 phage tail tape measure protein [Bacillus sp. ISL-101]
MEKIEGLSIGLGLDTLKLDSGLTDLKEKLKLVNSAMKANMSAFDRSDKSLGKFETRLQGLNAKLETQKAVTDKARKSYEKMVKEHGEGSKEADEAATSYNNEVASLNNLERYVGRVRIELKNLQKEQRLAESGWGRMSKRLTVFSGKLNETGHEMSEVGQGMTSSFGVATAAVGGGLAFATKKAMDFESQISSMKSVMSPEEAESFGKELENLAITMGEKTKYSATEAAQGIEELVKAGVSVKDILGGGLEGALNLATAGTLELQEAAEIASTALNAFKDDNISVTRAADILAGTANASATAVGEMNFALSAVSAVASGVGLNFEETSATLGVFAQNGLKGSDAGTSLKTMLLNLSPHTKAAREQFDELGLSAYNVSAGYKYLVDKGITPTERSVEGIQNGLKLLAKQEAGAVASKADLKKAYDRVTEASGLNSSAFYNEQGEIRSMSEIAGLLKKSMSGLNDEQRQNALNTMFGSDAIRAGNILYKEGAKGIDGMTTALNKIKASDVAKQKLDNLKGTIEELKGALETAGISVGTELLPSLRGLAEHIQSSVEWFNNLSPSMKHTIAIGGALSVVVLGLGTAVGVLLSLLGSAATGISVLSAGLGKGIGLFGKYRIQTALASTSVSKFGNSALVASTKMNTANASMAKSTKGMGALRGGAVAAGGAMTMFGGKWGAVAGIATMFLPEILKGGKAVLGFGKTALASVGGIGTLTKGLGAARLGVGALGGPIGLLASFAIPQLITGGVKLYKHLKEEQIPALNDFGNKVSDSTTKAVLGYKKLNDDATVQLNLMSSSGKAVSQDMADNLVATFSKMGGTIKDSLKKDFEDSKKNIESVFSGSVLTDNYQKELLGKMETANQEKLAKIQQYEDRVKEITDRAVAQKRETSQFEKAEIAAINQQMRDMAVKTLSEGQVEQQAIMEELRLNASSITARQAAKTVADSKKAKDGTIKEANEKYEKAKAAIIRERDETGSISAEEADTLIREARRQKNESVKKANEMHKGVVKASKKQAKEHIDDVNWETGEVLTGWDKMVGGVKKAVDWFKDVFGQSKTKDKPSLKKPNKSVAKKPVPMMAKGTPNGSHPGGPAIVSEKGRELIHEPGKGTYLSGSKGAELRNLAPGTSVLPNHHTEKVLKRYGMPGYEKGTGDYFDWMLKGPKHFLKKGFEKFNLKDSMIPSWMNNLTGSPIKSMINMGTGWIKGLMDKFSLGGGGEGGGNAPNISGGASAWRGQILKAAMAMKESINSSEINGIIAQIQRESGGNQRITQSSAVVDINTLSGNPARGLLQYIPQTFRSYAVKGHNNIYSGYDQLLAFFNNKTWRRDLPYGKRGWSPRGGRKFETGGFVKNEGLYNLAEGGWPEWVIPTDPSRRTDAMKLLALAGKSIEGGNKRPNQLPNVRGGSSNDSVMSQLLNATLRQNEILSKEIANLLRIISEKTGDIYLGKDQVGRVLDNRSTNVLKSKSFNMGVR